MNDQSEQSTREEPIKKPQASDFGLTRSDLDFAEGYPEKIRGQLAAKWDWAIGTVWVIWLGVLVGLGIYFQGPVDRGEAPSYFGWVMLLWGLVGFYACLFLHAELSDRRQKFSKSGVELEILRRKRADRLSHDVFRYEKILKQQTLYQEAMETYQQSVSNIETPIALEHIAKIKNFFYGNVYRKRGINTPEGEKILDQLKELITSYTDFRNNAESDYEHQPDWDRLWWLKQYLEERARRDSRTESVFIMSDKKDSQTKISDLSKIADETYEKMGDDADVNADIIREQSTSYGIDDSNILLDAIKEKYDIETKEVESTEDQDIVSGLTEQILTEPVGGDTETPDGTHDFLPRHTDFENLRVLGNSGQSAVVEHEKQSLRDAGRDDLAERVVDIATSKGDGTGYDVLSFDPDGAEKYIEVKTTKKGTNSSFFLTENEIALMETKPEGSYLYRIVNWDDETHSGDLFIFKGYDEISRYFTVKPSQYKLKPKK